MKYSNTVEYNIKTSLDSKGLTQLKSELQGLELKLQNMGNKGFLDEKTFVEARNQIQGLGQALTDAFNPSLGMLDLSKLNQELKNNDVTAQGLKTAFSSLGAEGQVAFNNLVGELGKLDTGILRTNSQIDKLFTTFSNTFRWGLVSSFFSQFMNAIHSSVDYVKELDDSLTQIMLVTDYNRDSMNEFAKSANEAAKAVSMTTTGMTNASLIFAQQGYDLGQSQELATLSAKLANASQQDTATTSDQITAYMNAYGLENSIEELTQQMDNWALIANVSAADVGELAQASQRAASMANAVGVSGEQLAAQIATIESVTREAPEQIGNGLKTLYARFSDIAAGKEDEDGFSLGKVTSELNKIGVQVLNEIGQIRDVGDIMEDLMVIWDDLDQTSKVAASQALAGKYQVNRFMALMDNSDMYQEYKGATGSAATGTLDQMNEEFANSIAGRTAKLQASLEGLFSTIFNTDDIYPWMDAAQGAVDLLQEFFDALGGGKTVLLGISSLLMQIFSKNMAQEINNAATNRAVQQQKLENLQNSQAALTTLGAANPNPNDANSQNILNFAQYMQANAKNFNAEQMDQANSILQELIQNSNAATMAADKLKDSLSVIGTGIAATTGESILAPFLDSEGAVNATLLSEALQNMSQSEIADMFSHIQEDIKPAREGLLEFNKALQDYQQELRNADSTDNSWTQSLVNLQAALDNLDGKIDPSTYERYEQAVKEIAEVTENAGDKTAETTAEVAKLADGLEKVTAKDLTNLNQLNKDAFQAKNTQMATEDSGKVAGAFQEGMDSQAQIQEILNTFNAVQQLTFAWQAFQNLGSLWANEDLSIGEKVLQTIMNLTMAMPQLISAMQTLQDNSFLQNVGNGLMNILNGDQTNLGDLIEIGQNNTLARVQKLLSTETEGIAAYEKMIEQLGEGSQEVDKSLEFLFTAGEAATNVLEDVDDELINLAKNGNYVETELTGLSKVFVDGVSAAMTEGATGMGLFAGGLKAVAVAAAEAIVPLLPFIAVGAAIAGIAYLIGKQAEEAKKAKEEALEAFDEAQSKLEQIQTLQEKTNNFQANFESKKSEGKGFEGLADEARDLAKALDEAGHASESADIQLAATKAAALGTEEAYQDLADAVNKASLQAEMDANTDVQKAAVDVINTQKANLDEIIQKQSDLRDLKEQLNDLEQDDPGRTALEKQIDELEDYISKNQEAVDATNQLREAQAANVGLQLSQETLDTVHSSGIDDATKRAGTYQEYAGTYDYNTLNAIYSENVTGWDTYTDLEKIDIMLNTLQDDAQIAAVEIERILQSNSNIRDMDYSVQGLSAEEQRDNITGALENTGLSAEQNLQLMATFDKDANYKDIMSDIKEVQQSLENGEDFEVILKAKFDPEQIEQGIKEAINAYEPTDEDVDADAFKNMANYIQGADASAFEEGGMLEDVSPDIQNNAEALEELVEGILRYDDAVSTLNDKEEDWRNALSDNADLQDRAEAVADLKETYSDFLDLGADVSDSFAENSHNLDLMAEAANGSEEAYNQLLAAASQDIAVNVYGVDESSAALEAMANYLQSDAFQDIDVGMNIEDQAFYDALNQMAQDANWTAADMEAYLSDIGCSIDPSGFEDTANSLVDAADQTGKQEAEALNIHTTTTVESAKGQETDTTEYTSAIANVTSITGESVLPVTGGNLGTLANGTQISPVSVPYSIPSVEYTAVPITRTDVQEKTGYAVQQKAEQGSGAGGVQVKPGSVKKSNSGGTKNRNASAPRSSGGGGGGGGRGSCFVAGTLISTPLCYKNIEEIQEGDIVLSYNEWLETNEYSKVLQTMIHDTTEPIYTLYIKNEQLRVTGIHRFLITDKIINGIPQWVHAKDLHVGDWVLFADGTWHVIHKIEVNIEHQIVYNFEVSNNHNYYVGRNQILAHNKGGKGGGGGSGGKAKEPKKIEPKEKKIHEKDYYEEVNSQLDKTEKILSKIKDEEDRLIGDKARANQNKQLDLLQKEIDLNKEKQKIQKQELKDVDARIKEQDRLAEAMARTGGVMDSIPDAVFDEDGIVANYEQISAAIDNIHNKLINRYNAAAAAGNEDLTKELTKTIDKFDKYGDNLLKSAQRHNKLQTEIEGTIEELEKLQDAIEDIRIDAWKASTEAIDNIKELREQAADLEGFFSEHESDSPFRDLIVEGEKLNNIWTIGRKEAKKYYNDIIAAKQKALKLTTDKDERAAIQMSINYFKSLRDNLSDDQLSNGLLNLAYQDMLQLKEWFENPNAKDNIFRKNTAALKEAYEAAYNKVHDMALEFEKTVEDFRDAMIDAYDEIDDKQNRQIDKFDRVIDELEHFSDMYALYYGDESYDMMRDILQQQGNTLREQLTLQKELYAYWAAEYAKAIDIGDEKLIKELEDKMNDAEDKMLELAEEAAKAFADSYENAVKASTQHIIQDTIGDKNFDHLDRNWEWDKDYIDQYRDNVEKAYEMDKLRNKYTDLLNQAQGASLQTQDKIRAQMQEQLALLDGQATVSEYDVKLANAKLEILQKQIALEDAQRNKNQMKLRRDTQGNYRYVYTTNKNDVDKAQQELLDSEYDAYELSKNQQMNNYNNLLNTYQKYLSQREEILNNANLSEQEKLEQNAELYDKFLKFVNAAKEDFGDAAYGTLDILNWLTLNGTDYTTTAAKDMLNDLLDEQGNIKDETGVIWMDNATFMTEEVIPKISDAVTEADDDIKERLQELQENMVGDNGVIPSIVNGIEGEDGLTTALDEARVSTDGLVVATRDLMEALNGDNSALADAQEQLQNYLEELNNVKNASAITAQQLRDTQKELDRSEAEKLNYKTQLDDLASGKKIIENGKIVDKQKKQSSNISNAKSQGNWSAQNDAYQIWMNGKWGGGGYWYGPYVADGHTTAQADAVLALFNNGYGYDWMDTGGYTGTWTGDEGISSAKNGKLAMLHQKELVLNEEDTKNILAAVDIVRQIGVGLRNSAMNVGAASGKNLNTIGNTIEQRVEITASFPNATDADDIRRALLGLSDRAYQYAHRDR